MLPQLVPSLSEMDVNMSKQCPRSLPVALGGRSWSCTQSHTSLTQVPCRVRAAPHPWFLCCAFQKACGKDFDGKMHRLWNLKNETVHNPRYNFRILLPFWRSSNLNFEFYYRSERSSNFWCIWILCPQNDLNFFVRKTIRKKTCSKKTGTRVARRVEAACSSAQRIVWY